MPAPLTTRPDRPVRSRLGEGEDPDLVRAYLEDIGRTPLLTAEQEVDLSQRIEAGLYAAEVLRRRTEARTGATAAAGTEPEGPAAREATDAELAALAEDGRAARDHMLRANLRLVVSVARKFSGRDVPFLDVVQEGNLGLVRAVEKFDYAKGYKFSTYATWWIRQAIQRGMAEQSRSVRLPVHVVDDLNRLSRMERDLHVRLGREPTVEEAAEAFGGTPERVDELHRLGRRTISLDDTVGDEDETRVGDLMEDVDAERPDEAIVQDALVRQLRKHVRSLPPREALIVELRFGLYDGRPRTLEEVARQVGLTRERVRQLEKQSLSELRHPSRSKDLLDWAS